jgi:hypothetical protein
VIEWFSANKLVLNLQRTNTLKCVTINQPYCSLNFRYKDKCTEEAVILKFLLYKLTITLIGGTTLIK